MGSFLFPVVTYLFALSIYHGALKKYPYQFSLNKKKFVIGMFFNILIIDAALLFLMSMLRHNMNDVSH